MQDEYSLTVIFLYILIFEITLKIFELNPLVLSHVTV